MGRQPNSGAPSFRFLPSEVAEMEKALEASHGATPARHTLEALTTMFSSSPERSGQLPIQYKQVWNWFQNRRHSQKVKMSKTVEKLNDGILPSDGAPSRKSASAIAAASSTAQTKKMNDALELEFEAKSARDSAWYDVSMFLDHRISDTGEPEVKVRYTGFGPEEDEWVHIKTAVRQRSLPCEVLECVAVLPGDLILCFQEGSEQALYYDAHILNVQRRRHDVRGCRCRFWVRYLHDQTEEVVPLRKVCRRPETEYRLKQPQRSSKGATAVEAIQRSQVEMISPSPDMSRPEVHPSSKISSATPSNSTLAALVQNTKSPVYDISKQAVTSMPGVTVSVSNNGIPTSTLTEAAAKSLPDANVPRMDNAQIEVDGTSSQVGAESQKEIQSLQQQTPA